MKTINNPVYLPSCAVTKIEKSYNEYSNIILLFTLENPNLPHSLTMTLIDSISWQLAFEKEYEDIFGQSIKEEKLDSLYINVSCLVNIEENKAHLLGFGKENDKVCFNFSGLEYYEWLKMVEYAFLHTKIASKPDYYNKKSKL